jgi:hypothetical protein
MQIVKYSEAGVPLWTNGFTGPALTNDFPTAIATDGSNNLFVTVVSAGLGTGVNWATIKYSSSGSALWTNRYHATDLGAGDDLPCAIATDLAGNVIVTGRSTSFANQTDCVTIKYSGAGTPLWTNRFDGASHSYDNSWAIAVDKNNDMCIAGSTYNGVASDDVLLIKYSGAGVPLWTNRYNGPSNSSDSSKSITCDGAGNFYAAGTSFKSTAGDLVIIKYTGSGVPLWTNLYNGPANGDETGPSISFAADNSIIVAASSDGDSYGKHHYEFVTLKYATTPPSLTISVTNPLQPPVVSWYSAFTNYTLQSSSDLRANWQNEPGTIVTNGWRRIFHPNSGAPQMFYRLSQ